MGKTFEGDSMILDSLNVVASLVTTPSLLPIIMASFLLLLRSKKTSRLAALPNCGNGYGSKNYTYTG
jgi:hypothetical protein